MRRWIMRKFPILPAILLLALLLSAMPGLAEENNLLRNPGFEARGSGGVPSDWSTDAWFSNTGYTVFSTSEGDAHGGTASACVENIALNDARFVQTVSVKPNALYCLSGWIRAEDVSSGLDWGANLSIEGLYARSPALYDTRGEWRKVTLYGETGPDQTSVRVLVRLGGYSAECTGKAWFDDLSLTEVDELPDGVVASVWFTLSPSYEEDEWDDWEGWDEEEEPADEAAPAWPWLTVVSLLWLLAGAALLRPMLRNAGSPEYTKEENRFRWWLPVGLAAAFIVRAVIAVLVEGYSVDIGCFTAWGSRMLETGPAGFYSPDYFCDYPPAYMLQLGLGSWITRLLGGGQAVRLLILKLPQILSDLAIAWFIGEAARREGAFSVRGASILTLLMAFNPLMILNSAAWGQIDSVLALLLLMVALYALRGRWHWVLFFYVLAVLTKPQALMLGFLGLAAIIVTLVRIRGSWQKMLIGLAMASGLAVNLLVPFSLFQEPGWLFAKYGETLSSYPYATVNTANLYYLFGANWNALENTVKPGISAVLALIAMGWGAFCLFAPPAGRRARWLEPALMGTFCVFFAVCEIVRPDWRVMGYGAMALAFAVTIPLWIRSSALRDLPFCGGLLFLMLFTLGIKMHERYLFPAIVLFGLAFALRRDRRILLLLLVLTATMFLNVAIPLDNSIRLGAAQGHLNADTDALAKIIAVINLLAVGLALWTGHSLCIARHEPAVNSFHILPQARESTRFAVTGYAPDHRLHWRWIDTLLLTGLTLVYSAVALTNLGSMKAPQTAWTSSTADEQVVLDLGERHEDFSVLYYCGVSYRDFSIAVSDDGKTWSNEYWAEMNQGSCYRWAYVMPVASAEGSSRRYAAGGSYDRVLKLSGRYVRVTSQQIGLNLRELIFRETEWTQREVTDEETGESWIESECFSGAEIPAAVVSHAGGNTSSPLYSEGKALADEPGTCEGEPTWYNSTYFDEIYHARTAYEHLHGEAPYETTHPPLGKLLMSACIAVFGMTPFGWRLAGCLAGILMIPALYLLGKQLTKRTLPAFAAAAMLSLDCMHFTQTRIATIDSFPVLFIMLAFLFMLHFMQRDLCAADGAGRLRSLFRYLPDLALSGFFMGCAVSSKWIGVYAGIGLALLFFWTCARQLRLSRQAKKLLEGADLPEEERLRLSARSHAFRRVLFVCLWCLLFFVAVPLVIYLLCYIPYFANRHITNILEFIEAVIGAQQGMLSYHATPGLGMDHPFYSPWYEWPTIVRPMYYAMAAYQPDGMSFSIFCFGNPAVWYAGIVGMAFVLFWWLRGHRWRTACEDRIWRLSRDDGDVSPAFILIGFLAQFLPWVLVPRGTYIYHYFASVPFLILAVAWSLHRLGQRSRVAERIVTALYLSVCIVFFLILFPYASGLSVPTWWLDLGKLILHVYYA